MGSDLKQWESDPLFSAAEVVQDSADRMESIFRLLLHELSLLKDDHPDPKLHTSMDCLRRDLATTLETSKWQLEDFERAVDLSSSSDKSREREDVISRHKQFVRAIKEQIIHVEKSLEDSVVGRPSNNAEWVNLNEQDRDGLALFLSGGDPNSDNNMLKRFLDPTTASTSKDNSIQMVEIKSREFEKPNMNGIVHTNHSFDGNLRRVGSHYSIRLGLEALGSLQEASSDRLGEDGSWDLEANRAKPKSFPDENKLRGYNSRSNLFGFFSNLWNTYGSRVTRTCIKKLKDGEEQRPPPSYTGVPHSALSQRLGVSITSGSRSFYGLCYGFLRKTTHQIQACRARYPRSPYYIQANKRHSIILTLGILCILIALGIFMPEHRFRASLMGLAQANPADSPSLPQHGGD